MHSRLLVPVPATCVLALLTLFQHAVSAEWSIDSGRSTYIYKDCKSCHGELGEGNQRLQAPNLAGRAQWYLELQLNKYRDGIRGTHDEDEAGKVMAPVSKTLDEESVQNISAYLASITTSDPEHTLDSGDAAAGRDLYNICMICHGSKGEGKQQLKAPGLVLLNDWYIVQQLTNFKKGVRGTHPDDRGGAQMRPFAMKLKDNQAMLDLTTYIKTLSRSRK